MDSNLPNLLMNNHEEKLASGDASCTDSLVLSPSLTNLLPHPDAELQKEKNADIWRYEAASSDKSPSEDVECTPTFFPIGSLRKTKYQDSFKRQGKTLSNKGPNENKLLDRNNKNPKGSHSNECCTVKESQPALNFLNMARLFACQACHAAPMTSMTVHMCDRGHQVCGNCFNHDTACAVCGEPLEGRNHPVETALHKLKLLRPDLFFQEFLVPSDSDPGEVSHLRAAHRSSHKPVQCPHLSCRSTVAYNGFLQHFKFEHSAVPVVTTAPGCSHQFSLPESLLSCTSARVLAVFKIMPRKFDGDSVICCLLSVPFQLGCVDKSLVVWCSSPYDDGTSPPLTYSLESTDGRRSMAYHGPMTSLHDSTESILKDGRCLIVPPGMIENFPLQNESSNILQIKFFINN